MKILKIPTLVKIMGGWVMIQLGSFQWCSMGDPLGGILAVAVGLSLFLWGLLNITNNCEVIES